MIWSTLICNQKGRFLCQRSLRIWFTTMTSALRVLSEITGKQTPAVEILSGAVREWLYEAIIERLLDNGIIPARPVIF